MLIGAVLGTQIAKQVIAPDAPPQARALIIAQWIKIANTMCQYIQTNAQIVVPPMVLMSPPGAPPAIMPTVVLVTPTGPAIGSITIPSQTLKVL